MNSSKFWGYVSTACSAKTSSAIFDPSASTITPTSWSLSARKRDDVSAQLLKPRCLMVCLQRRSYEEDACGCIALLAFAVSRRRSKGVQEQCRGSDQETGAKLGTGGRKGRCGLGGSI